MAASRGPASARGQADVALLMACVLCFGGLLPGMLPTPSAVEPSSCRFPVDATRAGSPIAEVSCASAAGVGAPLRGAPGLLFGMPLDLNRAGAVALESLPGIGPRRAASIVDERCKRRFKDLADLERVQGIGPITVDRLGGWAVAISSPICLGSLKPERGITGALRAPSLDPREGGG